MACSAPATPVRHLDDDDSICSKVPLFHRHLAVLVGLAIACWPTGRWFLFRVTDGSDEPWGILALAAALAFIPWRRAGTSLPGKQALALVALLILYSLLPAQMPPLVGGIVAVTALAVVACGMGAPPAVGGLLLLSLPLIASLQFFLGYPLRVLTASLSAGLLHLFGYDAMRQGTLLEWAGETIVVDAPCSGVRMLWSTCLLAAFLAAWLRLNFRASVVVATATVIAVILGNAVRATGLFFTELRLVPAADYVHTAWGLACFTLVGLAVAVGILRWASSIRTFSEASPQASPPTRLPTSFAIGLWLTITLAATVSLSNVLETPVQASVCSEEPVWPLTFDGRPLDRLPLSEADAAFTASFPGHIALFTDGRRRLLFREITRPTRLLHPPEDCLRGMGYAVSPRPIFQDSHGAWGCVHAERTGERLVVRSQIRDAEGTVYTDVSAWYWACLLGKSPGPWRSLTIWAPAG